MTHDQYRHSVIQAIKEHPDIAKRGHHRIAGRRRIAIDQFSDMDVLLVVRDVTSIAKVNSWLPNSERIVINAFHLSNYCTVLLNDFRKIDIAIFSTDDPSSRWVIHDYEVIKGDKKFQERLADAAAQTRQKSAAYLNPDLSVDNVLLLLVTACHRVGRGELLARTALCRWLAICSLPLKCESAVLTQMPICSILGGGLSFKTHGLL